MRRPFVIGNWKMNGTIESSRELAVAADKEARSLSEIDIGICPPFVRIAQAAQVVAGGPLQLGAQDCAKQSDGAFTGEVSAKMLEAHGCRLTLVGHSERRTLFGETDADVAQKAQRALEAGLMPMICVGESLDERNAGRTEERVGSQLDAVLDRLQAEQTADLSRITVAYEPVWAIGTGLSATPEQAGEVHAFLRRRIESRDPKAALRIRILYGGSVGQDNARALFSESEIDGALVGGASLDAEKFAKICQAASRSIHRSESDRSG
ncbi:triose-phosphate isomerase [Thioalkalivibrio sp. HK1]|uniref:triose-phosphate isomerase n=1 Tax=Thioalkalivibrio sp. HK1 TaxID=1469245 RepID=UPI00046EAF68|nr:triose-phosphate isomerase [Thioalkalivibrio sp. HK1]